VNLLSHAFDARDLLHEAIGINAAVVYSNNDNLRPSIVVQAPIGPQPLGGRLPPARITLKVWTGTATRRSVLDYHDPHDDPPDPLPQCLASITPGTDIERAFRLSRNNLLGWLGSYPDHPLLGTTTPPTPDDLLEPWLLARLHGQVTFDWLKQNQHVYLTEPLIPKSLNLDDHQRNNNPFPRYKVFKDRRITNGPSWTYARLHPNGRDLDPHGPMFDNPSDAREDAEYDALEKGHFPVASTPPYIALWQSRWTTEQCKHTAVITCDERITIWNNNGEYHARVSRQHKTGDLPLFGKHPYGKDEALTEARRLIDLVIDRTP
jgi:hypothetical protein